MPMKQSFLFWFSSVLGLQNLLNQQDWYEGMRRSSASPRPPCDGIISPPSGHRPNRGRARHVRIPHIGLHLTQQWNRWTPRRQGPAPRISAKKIPMGVITNYAGDLTQQSLSEYQVIRHTVIQSVAIIVFSLNFESTIYLAYILMSCLIIICPSY